MTLVAPDKRKAFAASSNSTSLGLGSLSDLIKMATAVEGVDRDQAFSVRKAAHSYHAGAQTPGFGDVLGEHGAFGEIMKGSGHCCTSYLSVLPPATARTRARPPIARVCDTARLLRHFITYRNQQVDPRRLVPVVRRPVARRANPFAVDGLYSAALGRLDRMAPMTRLQSSSGRALR